MEELRGKLTVLAISHQTALVESADRVYRLENRRAVPVAVNERKEPHAGIPRRFLDAK
jgi:ABC-type transport system involved in cytochrome bd biosynthesis fused ATPase/permease subunit